LAVEDGGFKDRVQLITEDDLGCIPANSVSAAQKLIDLNNVKTIIGPMCTGALLAVLPVTEKNKVIVVSPSATGEDITGAGKYIFRTIASDADKGTAVANYAYDKGFRKAAFLFDSSQDSLFSQKNDVKKTFTDLGGQIVIEEPFASNSGVSNSKDTRSQLSVIKGANPDVIFISAMPDDLVTILKQAQVLSIKTTLISTDTGAGTQPVINAAKSASEGLIFPFAATPTNKEYTDFINNYKTKYGTEPPTYAAESYDAAMILIKSMVVSNGTADSIKEQLFKIGNNYYGASGVITFDQNGDVPKPMTIEAIQNGAVVQVGQ
jgi:branched-chain amino acid transport system substrate-binding protein